MGVCIGIEASHRLWTLQRQALCIDTDSIYFAKHFLIELPRSKYPLYSKKYSTLGRSAVKLGYIFLFILPHCKGYPEVYKKKIPMVYLSWLWLFPSLQNRSVSFLPSPTTPATLSWFPLVEKQVHFNHRAHSFSASSVSLCLEIYICLISS